MKVTRIQAAVICGVMIAICFLGNDGGLIGVSSQTINGEYKISGATNFIAIIISLPLLFFIFAFRPKHQSYMKSKRVPLWRRLSAFYIDFVIALSAVTPILSLPIILLEFVYTDQLQWTFTRTFERHTDTIVTLISVLLVMRWVDNYSFSFF